ncbi:MAG TPA: SRPBCC family protein [Verrucomicrobiae bacterium]|nr:SRPBCC family protein [Verrucomicrobiae bacterium]
MPVICINTEINAPVERVFDLCRSIELHETSTKKSKERAVAGTTRGLIGSGETVTWEATHFFIRQRLSVKITKMDRPNFFEDKMIQGAFRQFTHQHFFERAENGTRMRDVFEFDSPFGFIGKIADFLFLKSYMRRLIADRNTVIRQIAESDQWKKFLKQ